MSDTVLEKSFKNINHWALQPSKNNASRLNFPYFSWHTRCKDCHRGCKRENQERNLLSSCHWYGKHSYCYQRYWSASCGLCCCYRKCVPIILLKKIIAFSVQQTETASSVNTRQVFVGADQMVSLRMSLHFIDSERASLPWFQSSVQVERLWNLSCRRMAPLPHGYITQDSSGGFCPTEEGDDEDRRNLMGCVWSDWIFFTFAHLSSFKKSSRRKYGKLQWDCPLVGNRWWPEHI